MQRLGKRSMDSVALQTVLRRGTNLMSERLTVLLTIRQVKSEAVFGYMPQNPTQ